MNYQSTSGKGKKPCLLMLNGCVVPNSKFQVLIFVAFVGSVFHLVRLVYFYLRRKLLALMIHFHKIPPNLDAFLSRRIFTRNGEPTYTLHTKRTLYFQYFMRCSKNHEASVGRRQTRIKRVGFIVKM